MSMLEGRRVVHSVSGDRHDVTVAREQLHDSQFLQRLHPREDACVTGQGIERGVALLLCGAEFGSGNGLQAIDLQARVAPNRQSGRWIIAGDHRHTDSGRLAGSDRIGHFRPERILHAGKAEEGKAGEMTMAERAIFISAERPSAKADPEPLRGQFLLLRKKRGAVYGDHAPVRATSSQPWQSGSRELL